MKKKINLALPEWAWLYNDDDTIQNRDILLHVRSASIIEFVPAPNIGGLTTSNYRKFTMPECLGEEVIYALPHYIAGDADCEDADLTQEILDKAIAYYVDWSEKEEARAIEDLQNDILEANN
ncbi:MAG: hypothetical protein RR383_05275 [Muribaculaceae bacterium]